MKLPEGYGSPAQDTDVKRMTSIDFTAAKQRVQARRDARAAQDATTSQNQRLQSAARTPTWLPSPLQAVTESGLDKWKVIRGRVGTVPAFRVGQVDAELLDEELLELLQSQMRDALKYFEVRIGSLPSRFTSAHN